MPDEHDEGYTGPAVLTVDGREVAVTVVLDARHEPHDGRLHWFGRLTLPDAEPAPASADVALAAGAAAVPARLGEADPWGRYRVSGVGALPFVRDDPSLDE